MDIKNLNEPLDIEKEFDNEIHTLKETNKRERRFQNVKTKCKNCIFISIQLPEPYTLINDIFDDIRQNQNIKSRYIQRIIPVEITCKAYLKDIAIAVEHYIPTYFPEELKPNNAFLINIKIRNNNSLNRDDIIREITKLIHRQNPNYKADLENPDISILVEVLCTTCGLSFVDNFFKFKRFNMLQYSNFINQTLKKTTTVDDS
ncbi:THUMP domain-containing protein 1 homolog isoform X2 [Gordionus sp. m RMFG-2023]